MVLKNTKLYKIEILDTHLLYIYCSSLGACILAGCMIKKCWRTQVLTVCDNVTIQIRLWLMELKGGKKHRGGKRYRERRRKRNKKNTRKLSTNINVDSVCSKCKYWVLESLRRETKRNICIQLQIIFYNKQDHTFQQKCEAVETVEYICAAQQRKKKCRTFRSQLLAKHR